MKPADADRQTRRKERTCEIDRARELIGLDADQRNQRPPAVTLDVANDPRCMHTSIPPDR
jgi:hypothetical protein